MQRKYRCRNEILLYFISLAIQNKMFFFIPLPGNLPLFASFRLIFHTLSRENDKWSFVLTFAHPSLRIDRVIKIGVVNCRTRNLHGVEETVVLFVQSQTITSCNTCCYLVTIWGSVPRLASTTSLNSSIVSPCLKTLV